MRGKSTSLAGRPDARASGSVSRLHRADGDRPAADAAPPSPIGVYVPRRPPTTSAVRSPRVGDHLVIGAVALLLVLGLARTLGLETALWGAGAFLFVWVLTPAWGRWLASKDILDLPGGHSGHRGPVPTVGGLLVAVPLLVVTVIAGLQGWTGAWGLLGGTVLVLLTGIRDDLDRVRPVVKVAAQLTGGGLLLLTGFRIEALGIPGLGFFELGELWGALLLLFWVVLVTNAVNLIDGLDGLATTVGLVSVTALVVLGVHPLLAVVLGGALLGFLPHNLPRARIFLGDTGSLTVGFVLAALLLEVPASRNVPLAVGLMAYPLADVALVSLRRFVRGKPFFTPDRSHVHHKLRQHLGERDGLVVAVVFGMAALAAVLALTRGHLHFLFLLVALWVLLAVVLVMLGRVDLGLLVSGRSRFQRLHLLRAYLIRRLDLVKSREEVGSVLHVLVCDAPLVRLRMGEFVDFNGIPDPPCLVEDVLELHHQQAVWAYESEPDEERALTVERLAVVSDVLRYADSRLGRVRV